MRKAAAFFLLCIGLASSSILREDPILEWSFLFNCNIPGLGNEVFTSFWNTISGIQNRNEWECERFTTVNGREVTSCLPSQLVTSPVTLERILTFDDTMWQWRDLVANGQLNAARSNCTVSLYGRNYTELFTFTFYNAFPVAWDIEPFGTMEVDPHTLTKQGGRQAGSAALYEKLTLVHEALAREGQPVPILIRVGPGAKKSTPPPTSVDEDDLKNTIAGILGIDPSRITIVSQNINENDGYLDIVFTINNIMLGTGAFFDEEGAVSGIDQSATALAVAFVDLRKIGDYDSGDITGDSTSPICVKVIPSGYSSEDTDTGPCNRGCGTGYATADDGETVTLYNRENSCTGPCESAQRTCTDGKLSGPAQFKYDWCSDICP